jgi:hypothetical protein
MLGVAWRGRDEVGVTRFTCIYVLLFLLCYLLSASLHQLGDQLALVSTIKQHVPSLGNILKLGVDDLLAVLGLDLSRLDPACQVSGSLLGVLQVVNNDESWLSASDLVVE